jgi:hypothetical protein
MMTQPRQIALVRDYDGLIQALRARADELRLSRQSLDEISGLQSGYSSKLLAPVPIKTLGQVSFGPALGAMGLAIVVIEDAEQLAKIAARIAEHAKAGRDAARQMPPGRRRNRGWFSSDPLFARLMSDRAIAKSTPAQRSRAARHAARARWRAVRARQIGATP